MARDQQGNKLSIGDKVILDESMALKFSGRMYPAGKIIAIDGELILVKVAGVETEVERYGSELFKAI